MFVDCALNCTNWLNFCELRLKKYCMAVCKDAPKPYNCYLDCLEYALVLKKVCDPKYFIPLYGEMS